MSADTMKPSNLDLSVSDVTTERSDVISTTTTTTIAETNTNNNNSTNNNTNKNTLSFSNSMNAYLSASPSPILGPSSPSFKGVEFPESREQDFLEKNEKGWIHGVKIPYGVFKYEVYHEKSTKTVLSKEFDQDHFVPRIILDEVEHSAFGGLDSKRSSTVTYRAHEGEDYDDDDDDENDRGDILRKEDTKSAFSGYYSIPKASLNIPGYYKQDPRQARLLIDIPKLCYQNHFDYDDLTYTFGGLYVNKFTNFKALGLPKNIDLNKISIHLPTNLPPFVSKEILCSPFMNQNRHFYLFNPIRGTITFLDTINLTDFPGHLCSLTSTQISKSHIFFYGGFEIETISVNYNPEIGRWIIKKDIKLNEDGYILDITNLKFTKIDLKSKSKSYIPLGRLGSAMVSNIYGLLDSKSKPNVGPVSNNSSSTNEIVTKTTSPITTYTPTTTTNNNNNKSKPSTTKTNTTTTATNIGTPLQKIQSPNPTSSNHPNFIKLNEISTTSSVNDSDIPPTPATPYSTSGQFPFQKQSIAFNSSLKNSTTQSLQSAATTAQSSSVDTSNSKPFQSIPNLKPVLSSNGSATNSVVTSPSTLTTNSNNSSTSSSAVAKMTNVFSKSSRIFQRHHHQRQPSTLESPKSPQAAHPLKNTYSKQVKQNRSNSQHSSNGSRPASPVQNDKGKSTLVKESPATLKIDSNITTTNNNNNSSKVIGDYYPYTSPSPDLKQSPTNSNNGENKYEVIIKHSAQDSSSSSSTFESGTKKFQQKDYLTVEKIDNTDAQSFDSFMEEENVALFEDPVQKSGLAGVSIFVFGGFIPVIDDSGFMTFKASNDLLKIDLATKDDQLGINFQTEAIVTSIGREKDCPFYHPNADWPTPRGFYAGALIKYNGTNDVDCEIDLNPELTGEQLKRVSTTVSNTSSVGASFHTLNSGNGSQAPKLENFFEGKAFLVQGGCNENLEFFSDFYIFVFDTAKWEKISTYSFDYFDIPIKPYEDDDGSKLNKENELDDAIFMEAEFRACHHRALYYQNEECDYLFFIGGFYNDYLRYFDKIPYESDKFDVTRLSKFPFATNNTNLLRIPVLNLQTQTWRYLKYYYDVNHVNSDIYNEKVSNNPTWINARIMNYGGSISLNGKSITICHGMAMPCPEKKKDLDAIQKAVPSDILLWGAHVHFTFPSL
ncbi:uncharacterized protein RJT21DRAFT_121050 [Scheffersomyces amazonensis]|uniref:uncharacterized protein n=1 Tax=Scheffersomyces amazonensis TaxID=1078765 RepID=UPI00315CDD5E